jgi:hypothetical protein
MTNEKYATTEESAGAIRQLSDADHQKLLLAARFWHAQRKALQKQGITPEDLLSQAYLATLAGHRRWRRSISLVKHLSQCMRSISGHMLEHGKTELTGKTELRKIAVVQDRSASESAVEGQVNAREEIENIEKLFADDKQAFEMLLKRAAGIEPEEIRAEMSLNSMQYATISRRILRKLTSFVN